MGLFEHQLHNQFKFNESPTKGASSAIKLLSNMDNVQNSNEKIKNNLNTISKITDEIQKLKKSTFDLEDIYKLNHKISDTFKIIKELDKNLGCVSIKLVKLEEDLPHCPLNKTINISINNGTISINENK